MSVADFLLLVDRLYAYLSSDQGVAVHCRMGIGRSSVVAACLLVKSGKQSYCSGVVIGFYNKIGKPMSRNSRQVENLSYKKFLEFFLHYLHNVGKNTYIM